MTFPSCVASVELGYSVALLSALAAVRESKKKITFEIKKITFEIKKKKKK